MKINFKYQKTDNIIQYNGEPLKALCQNFANDKSLDINTLLFYYKGNQITLDENITAEQLLYGKNQGENPNDISNDQKKMTIKVFKEIPFTIKYSFKSIDYHLNAEETDKIKDVFKECATEQKVEVKEIYFFKNGDITVYDQEGNKTVNEFANKFDKESKTMAIVLYDFDRNSEQGQYREIKDTPVDIKIIKEGNMFIIYFTYEGYEYYIQAKETDKIKEVFDHSKSKGGFNLKEVYFNYKGRVFFCDKIGENTIVTDFAKDPDKELKEMHILVNINDLEEEDEEDGIPKAKIEFITIEDDKDELLNPMKDINISDDEEKKNKVEQSEIPPTPIISENNSNINDTNINNQPEETPFILYFFLMVFHIL